MDDTDYEQFVPSRELEWNNDPAWVQYMERFEADIQKMISKYAGDSNLRDDCAQNARMALMKTFPERVSGYERYLSGEYTESQWQQVLIGYCRTTIRNQVLSTLNSHSEGDLYRARKRRLRDTETGDVVFRYGPSRMVSLDSLVEDGLQVDTEASISWPNYSSIR